jgi:hypothetical protein
VDGTFFNTSVPSTHTRKYDVAQNVTCIAPNELPKIAHQFSHYVILGGGKTAMDAAVWLLTHNASSDALTWVCPRDSWLINRATTQPGGYFFKRTAGAVAKQFQAMIDAQSVEDVFLKLEEAGNMLRVDKSVMPTMFHYATISEGELEHLSNIKHIIRNERVAALSEAGMTMTNNATHAMPENTLYIDCTATAAVFTGQRTQPVFSEDRLILQATYAPLVTYSAAIIAFVEANYDDIEQKNALCMPVQLADSPMEWLISTSQNMMNQHKWNQDKDLRAWLNACRLNPSYAAFKDNAMADPANAQLLKGIAELIRPALGNAQKLLQMHKP